MAKEYTPQVRRVFEHARIAFRNFEGREEKYNAEGKRNFHLLLDPDTADAMIKEGWNVKFLTPRDPQEEPQAHLKVNVKVTQRGPKAVIVTGKGQSELSGDMIKMLDWASFSNIDLIIRAYDWEVNGETGRTAYLASIYATLLEDELASKYYDVPNADLSEEDI